MTRRYGRARRGQRIHEGTPDGRWRTLTLLGAVGIGGWQAVMTVESATDGDVFLAYLKEVLCPTLQAGQVVVMDNLAAHKLNSFADCLKVVDTRRMEHRVPARGRESAVVFPPASEHAAPL